MGDFLIIVSTLGVLLAIVMLIVRIVVKKGWPYKRIAYIALAAILIGVLGAILSPAQHEGYQQAQTEKGQPEKSAGEKVKEPDKNNGEVTDVADDENTVGKFKDYITNTLDPLIRSVSSSIDTNWQFYFVEPVERFTQDGNLNHLQTDITLCADLFKGIIQQIDALEVPDYFCEEDVKLVNEVKDGLHKSIAKRIEAIDLVAKAQTFDEAVSLLNSDDVTNKILESNGFITAASQSYVKLLRKYEK